MRECGNENQIESAEIDFALIAMRRWDNRTSGKLWTRNDVRECICVFGKWFPLTFIAHNFHATAKRSYDAIPASDRRPSSAALQSPSDDEFLAGCSFRESWPWYQPRSVQQRPLWSPCAKLNRNNSGKNLSYFIDCQFTLASNSLNCRSRSWRYFSISSWACSLACLRRFCFSGNE